MNISERRLGIALAVPAGLNLALGVILATTQPRRAGDLATIYEWCRSWLLRGVDLYALPDAATDYPPNAIVMLSPLALLPASWLVPAWTVISLILAPLLPYLVVRASSSRIGAAVLLPIAAFLCWASARTFLQFSVLSLTLAFAAINAADSRPTTSGILLGLALFKPHIAGPAALYALFSGRIRIVAISAIVVAAGFAAYCFHAHANPVATTISWWHVLVATYGGPDGLIGLTSVRHWTGSDAAWLITSMALLVVPAGMALQSKESTGVDRLAVIACACIWSLLTFYHNGNNLILMLPAWVFLLYAEDRTPRGLRLAALAILQVALMIDVPIRLATAWPGNRVLHAVVVDFDRLIALAAFVIVAFVWRRRTGHF